MELADLATFEAVARTGTMTGAAAGLMTVQSNVTARVRLLERELGVALFDRHSRGVNLTAAGRQLLPFAERIRHLVGEAERAVRDDGTPRGPLQVGSLETIAGLRLPPILSAYVARYPEVDVSLSTGTASEVVDMVLARRVEVALVAGPLGHSDLVEQPILEEELVVVAPAGVCDLERHLREADPKLVIFRRGCAYRERLERYLADLGRPPARVLELGTLDGIIGCVGAGIGITMMPRAVVARHETLGLVGLHPIPPEQARVVIVLVRRRDAFMSSAMARFADACREVYADR
jgi:DNA-binding transcriptional LysR family regulator